MELQILISKKGTKVVTASNLYGALELPEQHYSTILLKWIDDFYEFTEGIRKPVRLQDYAKRKILNNPILKDYYLSLELAKKIVLRSKSKLKRKFANKLHLLQHKEQAVEVKVEVRTDIEKSFEEKGQAVGREAGKIVQKGVDKVNDLKEYLKK